MTRDDIIRMAREAGGEFESEYANISALEREVNLEITDFFDYHNDEEVVVFDKDQLARFAALVAKREREACADICDQHSTCEGIAQKCAAAIRARKDP